MEENKKTEKIFVNGMRFEAPSEITKEKAPWVKGKISIFVPDFITFLNTHESNSGWVNINLCKSQKGSLYLELNTWQPKKEIEEEIKENVVKPVVKEVEPIEYPEDDISASDIPF